MSLQRSFRPSRDESLSRPLPDEKLSRDSAVATPTGTLFLVPTPIGNFDDMTFRAVQTLSDVDMIAAEDTRHTARLLSHFDIHTRLTSLHEHNWAERVPELLAALLAGRDIAQVSDAGMPSISDPGHELVVAALAAEIAVVALPGASAGITALIASGLPAQPYAFYGFLPRKKQQQLDFLAEKAAYPETQIFYESSHRLTATLTNLITAYGDREAVLARELTKIYEEYRRDSLSSLLSQLTEQPVKGECLLIVAGADGKILSHQTEPPVEPVEAVKALISQGHKPNEAIKTVAKARQISRQDLYQLYHDL